ncbi:hypothetical protein [Synechococcus sp. UW140]|uniref:hypothetical protein n=1 Tax=Synechococcus sp. UW140 TaxID=368503 RepID=UPI0014827B6B|nr:hypothetical protein [Synechococcus sp. UW140]
MVVREERLMDKLERFKQLSDAMPMATKLELYQQFVSNPEAGINSIIALAAKEGLELNQAEVSELIKTIDVDEEFDDVELDAIALVAIAGRKMRNSRC